MKDRVTSITLTIKQAQFIIANKKMFAADKVAAARQVIHAAEPPALRRIMQTIPPSPR